MRQLRPHQSEAIHALRQSLARGKRRPMLQLPTGAGKTITAATIIRMALDKGNRVIFTVPAISLVDQTVREFYAEGIRDIGVIQADHPMTDSLAKVQVACVQTLQRRRLPEAGLVIVDEAHRSFDFIRAWMRKPEWAAVPFIGLSATPWAKGLGRDYDDLIVAATTESLIGDGYLSPFRVFAPTRPDLSGVRTVAGDYHEGDLSEAMQSGTITADVVTTWLTLGENRPTLCFAVDRAHAASLRKGFEAAGVSCGYVDAFTSPEEREAVRKAFEAGSIKVVCNVGVLTTGVDWDVRCIVLARPTKSEMLYTQIIGRGLRTAEGKADCLILDHSDTTMRLGFVTDIHHHRLCDGKPKAKSDAERKEPLPKECPECHYVRAPKVKVCPSCGFVGSRKDGIEVEEGELEEMNPSRQRKENRELGWAEKVAFMASLRAYAIETGKKDGWTAHKYREKFGVWPNDPRVKNARPAAEVSPVVRAWIRSRNIRWAKAQDRTRLAA